MIFHKISADMIKPFNTHIVHQGAMCSHWFDDWTRVILWCEQAVDVSDWRVTMIFSQRVVSVCVRSDLSAPCCGCPAPCCGARWRRSRRPGRCPSSAAPPGWADLSPYAPPLGCRPRTEHTHGYYHVFSCFSETIRCLFEVVPSSFRQRGSAVTRRRPPAWPGWSSRPAGWGTASPPSGATAAPPLSEAARNPGSARRRPTAPNTKLIKTSYKTIQSLLHLRGSSVRSYLVIGPAAPLPAAPPLPPAEVVQLLGRGGEAQQGVQLLVAEQTRGGHLHLQPVREVPQGADAVLHDLRSDTEGGTLVCFEVFGFDFQIFYSIRRWR